MTGHGDRSDLKILAVDDDELQLSVLTECLKELKHNIISTTNPETALEWVKENIHSRYPFDIIFIDLVMPQMSGFHMATELKKIDPYIASIAMTADDMDGNKYQIMKSGVFDYWINKNIDLTRLKNCLNKYICEFNQKK